MVYLYFEFRKILNDAQRTIAQLEAGEVYYLNSFTEMSSGRASVMDSSILCFFYDICKDYPPSVPEGFEQRKRPLSKSLTTSENKLEVYPNPANLYTTISWRLPSIEKGAILHIKDITGRTILTQDIKGNSGNWFWDTRKVINGFYLVEILRDKKVILVEKVVIQK